MNILCGCVSYQHRKGDHHNSLILVNFHIHADIDPPLQLRPHLDHNGRPASLKPAEPRPTSCPESVVLDELASSENIPAAGASPEIAEKYMIAAAVLTTAVRDKTDRLARPGTLGDRPSSWPVPAESVAGARVGAGAAADPVATAAQARSPPRPSRPDLRRPDAPQWGGRRLRGLQRTGQLRGHSDAVWWVHWRPAGARASRHSRTTAQRCRPQTALCLSRSFRFPALPFDISLSRSLAPSPCSITLALSF